MRQIEIHELVNWILTNRRNSAFRDYPPNKIASEVSMSMQQGVFLITTDKDEKITGVVCGEKNDKSKTIMIHDILATQTGVVKRFMQQCIKTYPYYKIVGECRNRPRIFNDPNKLERRLK